MLLYSSVVSADEYLISYRYSVKNSSLYNENLYISKAMKKCSGKPYQKRLFLSKKSSETLKETLLNNSSRFLQYLSKIGLNVNNNDLLNNQVDHCMTIITLKTTCFKVDFNENFVTLLPLK